MNIEAAKSKKKPRLLHQSLLNPLGKKKERVYL